MWSLLLACLRVASPRHPPGHVIIVMVHEGPPPSPPIIIIYLTNWSRYCLLFMLSCHFVMSLALPRLLSLLACLPTPPKPSSSVFSASPSLPPSLLLPSLLFSHAALACHMGCLRRWELWVVSDSAVLMAGQQLHVLAILLLRQLLVPAHLGWATTHTTPSSRRVVKTRYATSVPDGDSALTLILTGYTDDGKLYRSRR